MYMYVTQFLHVHVIQFLLQILKIKMCILAVMESCCNLIQCKTVRLVIYFCQFKSTLEANVC